METRGRTPLGLQCKVPGKGTSPEAIGWLNRDSNAEYPENMRSQIVPNTYWQFTFLEVDMRVTARLAFDQQRRRWLTGAHGQ